MSAKDRLAQALEDLNAAHERLELAGLLLNLGHEGSAMFAIAQAQCCARDADLDMARLCHAIVDEHGAGVAKIGKDAQTNGESSAD